MTAPSPGRVYVLDTSVLLAAPNAFTVFDEHQVVIPLVVIKELEAKRNDPSLGFSARTALRGIEALRGEGDIRTGVTVNAAGGTVRVEVNHTDQSCLPAAMRDDRTHDTRILAVAANCQAEGFDVVVVSKDMPMRILAETLGLGAQEYRNEQRRVETPYTGVEQVEVPDDIVTALYTDRIIESSIVSLALVESGLDNPFVFDQVPINTAIRFVGPASSAVGLFDGHAIHRLPDTVAFGVDGRSLEQKVALAHLMDPETQIVSLGGKAGTGKTFLALAAGLDQVLEQQRYRRVVVFRPMFSVGGQDLGYLPGSEDEKMAPWAGAITDAMEAMTSPEVISHIADEGMLSVQPLTYIRGRSLTDTFVIVDEAQNLELPVLLTALSRLGEGSKVALCWDAAQRDNLRVGRYDGIAAAVERLKGNRLFAHTTFTRSERGPVAKLVTEMLDDMIR